MFYKIFFKSIVADLIAFLRADINEPMIVSATAGHKIYISRENYLELVGIQRRLNIFQQFLSFSKLDTLAFERKIKLRRQNFTVNN